MTRVLITGGAGFVGVNLVAGLTGNGDYEVTVIDDESLGSRDHLAPYPVRFVPGDIRNEARLEEALEGQDVVVHLAADTRVMDSIEDPEKNFAVNVGGTFRLLQACRRQGVGRVVAASTGGAILGEAPAPVNEAMAAAPLAPYGASKLAMEGYLSAFTGAYGMRNCSLRFSILYGPRSFHKGSVVAHFFKTILSGRPLTVYGDGTQARDFLFVDDLVDGIRRAIEREASGVFQLGSGRATTVDDLIDCMKTVTGRSDLDVRHEPFRPGEVHTTWCDISKARAVLGFSPDTALEEGLARTWSWFLEVRTPA